MTLLKHTGGSNYKPRRKSVREIVLRARTISALSRQLNTELDKFTDEDLQKACAAIHSGPAFLKKQAESCIELADSLTDGGTFIGTEYTLAFQLNRLSTALSVEYDSKFIGVER